MRRILVQRNRVSGVELDSGERLEADAIIYNGAPDALAQGLLGDDAKASVAPVPREARTLSAVTWCVRAPTEGFDLNATVYDPRWIWQLKTIVVR